MASIPFGFDRRGATRYPIVATVSWEQGGDGVTQNISTTGAYVITAERPSPGKSVSVTITLPRAGIPVLAHGRVVRVDRVGTRFGVALRFEELELLSASVRAA